MMNFFSNLIGAKKKDEENKAPDNPTIESEYDMPLFSSSEEEKKEKAVVKEKPKKIVRCNIDNYSIFTFKYVS